MSIKCCLNAACYGFFFPDDEFELLFGISRDELKVVLSKWPEVDEESEVVGLAVNGTLVNLMGYPHGMEKELDTIIPGGFDALEALYQRWNRKEH